MRRTSWRTRQQIAVRSVHPHATATAEQRRRYTPIFAEPRQKDVLAEQRIEDEISGLCPSVSSIPDVPSAVAAWLRFRNDPVLHTQLPMGAVKGVSTFAQAEDYCGTNLVHPLSREHLRDSAQLWTEYFEKKYIAAMRHSRRTAANYIGTLTAPEEFTDEADRPATTWQQDVLCVELALIAKRALNEKVANLEQFELALRRSNAEAFLKFHDLFATQTQTLIPVPTLSVWVYEGERRKAWVEKFKELELAAVTFFHEKLRPAIAGANKWEGVAKEAAGVLRAVGSIQVARMERQLKDGVRKPWGNMTAAEKEQIALAEVITVERSIVDGDFDSEDSLDKSEAWLLEQAKIHELVKAPLGSCNFSFEELWLHTIRFEAFSTEHAYVSPDAQRVAASARVRMYDSGATLQNVIDAVAQSVELATVDLRSCTLVPHTNEIWCRLHWHKFGSGTTLVQQTVTARRILQYHHADASKLVAASAAYYFHTKPLSSSLDYSTPYKHRRSIVAQAAKYGVELMYATQRPVLTAAANLARAEGAIGAVVATVARPIGAIRRLAHVQERARVANGRIVPVTSAHVCSLEDAAVAEDQWPFGSSRNVVLEWEHPSIREFQSNPGATMQERITREAALKQDGVVQVSLMRKRTAAERMERTKELRAEHARVHAELLRTQSAVPALKEVEASAMRTYARLVASTTTSMTSVSVPPTFEALWEQGCAAELQTAAGTTEASTADDWVFVATLDDAHPLTADLTLRNVTIPYQLPDGSLLSNGNYCLRVRCINVRENPGLDPVFSSEVLTAPFTSFDALPQLARKHFNVKNISEELKSFDGSALVPFCQLLREGGGLSLPTKFEFEIGQNVGVKGEVFWDDFVSSLHAADFLFVPTRDRYTSAQRDADAKVRAHWELYNPGATDDEWYAVRHRELDTAFSSERDWWVPDEMLSTSSGFNSRSRDFVLRYSNDVCQVLDGSSRSGDGMVAATVTGTGVLSRLEIDATLAKRRNLSVKDVLQQVTTTIQAAHDRLNTLAAAKTVDVAKSSQLVSLLSQHQSEYGGRNGRTYAYAFGKAVQKLDTDGEAMLSQAMRVDHADEVDRFASQTNPDQRKKSFSLRMDESGLSVDDMDVNQIKNWGNSV